MFAVSYIGTVICFLINISIWGKVLADDLDGYTLCILILSFVADAYFILLVVIYSLLLIVKICRNDM